ncbi:hypothetical protein GRI44_13185 [Altererythrobacter confluentis]|uniref:Lipoprotein n=1 Tax=Allopontixanthobacter confluentis TaxID=1849021 RepID=A0A6L7GI19_9SPHN|nr:hypothetical protein [Allopontixanthobacter confluentis]MXP15703.1 hypothetical protein [Allopontixanthobacter confluentis]
MKNLAPLLLAGTAATACSQTMPEQPLCAFDENGTIITEVGNDTAACVEPAPIPNGASQESTGRLTILEAPLSAPFFDLDKQWPPDPANVEPELVRPAVPPELSYYIRAFPQDDEPAGDVLSLGSEHAIVLRDGCFFLDREGHNDPLVQFPYGIALEIDKLGYLAFGSRYEPTTMGSVRVGLLAETGWYTEPFDAPPELAAVCGQHKVVGVTTVSNPFAWPERFNPALRRYGERSDATNSQILERANSCAISRAQQEADRRLRSPNLEPVDCNHFWGF